MRRNDGAEKRADLVEPSGVNAGPRVDAEPEPAAGRDDDRDDRDGREGRNDRDAASEPAAEPRVSGNLSDEMAGLPGQLPGYPGQQRSVDTG